jgi:predicted RND superfamily exporter protein
VNDAPQPAFPTDWSHRLAAWCYDHRTAVLAACVGLAALAAVPAQQVGVDNAVQRWFTEGDPALAAYHDFQETFGNDELVVAALTPEAGLFTAEGLRTVRRATRATRQVDGVAGVTSLTTLPLLADRLEQDGGFPQERAAALRRTLRDDATLPPLLLGKDGRTAGLLIRMAPHAQIDGRRGHILDALGRVLDRAPAGEGRVAKAGTGVIHEALGQAAMEGSALLFLPSSVLLFLLLWAVFGRIGPVLVTMGAAGAATLWLLGIYGLFGGAFNTVTMVLPTLVLVITTADCVHLLLHAAHVEANAPRERAVRTVGFLLRPCAFTTLTTAAGFLALAFSGMPVVRELGIFAAVGLVGGLVASVVTCTWALSFEGAVPRRRAGLTRWAGRLAAFGVRRRRAVLAGAALLVAGAALGMTQLQTDTDSLGYLSHGHPARQDSRQVEARLGPYMPLEFVVRAPDALAAELLRAVARWEQEALRRSDAGWAWSAADVMKRLHAHLPNGRPVLPQSEARMAALLDVAETEADSVLRRFVASSGGERDMLRVTFGVTVQSARGFRQAMQRLSKTADLPAGATLEASGYLPLYVRMMQQVVHAQIVSFLAALVIITAMIGVLFRSARAALLSLGPNLLPIALTLGLMGAVGLPLDAATVTIAAVALGLIVDDTVHLLHRYLRHASGASLRRPGVLICRSASAAGAPLIATTLVLAGSFAVLLLAPIKSVAWFGLLIGTATLLALAADLLVTPALVAALGERAQPTRRVSAVFPESPRVRGPEAHRSS